VSRADERRKLREQGLRRSETKKGRRRAIRSSAMLKGMVQFEKRHPQPIEEPLKIAGVEIDPSSGRTKRGGLFIRRDK
jgi:hypothetical protein